MPKSAEVAVANRYAASNRRPRTILIWGIALLVLVFAFAFLIRLNPDKPFTFGMDRWWAELVGNGDQYSFPAILLEWMGGIGGLVVQWFFVIPLLIIRHWRSAIYVVVGLAVAPLFTELALKPVVDRPRPFVILQNLTAPENVNENSFPSGHSSFAGATAICLVAVVDAAVRRWMPILAAILCLASMWQRTMCNAHWLSDTIAGVMVGLSVGLLIWWAFYPAIFRDYQKGAERRAAKAALLAEAVETGSQTAA